MFNLNKSETINPVLSNHNDPEVCNILYWNNHYLLCKDVTYLLKKPNNHKCYPCLKCCVSFEIENALNKHLDLFNNIGRRTLHHDDYLKFDKYRYKNRVPFTMEYDFEFIIKTRNTFLLLVGYILKVIIKKY